MCVTVAELHIPLNSESATCGVSRVLLLLCYYVTVLLCYFMCVTVAELHIPLNSESATCGVSRVLRTVCTVGKVEGRDRR